MHHSLQRKVLFAFFSFLACTVIAAPARVMAVPPTGPGPTWASLPAVPAVGIGVEGMSVACVGDQIIAALGYDFGDTAATRLYNIALGTWSAGALAPGPSSEGAGAAHGGLFYNLGGRGPGFTANWSYDPATDLWTANPPMPTGRAGLAAAVVGNALYAIGGRINTGGPNSGLPLAVVERYDIDAGSWSAVAPLPAPRSDLAAAAVGGKIYVFGGFDAAGLPLASVDVYDPVSDTWAGPLAPMPTARGAMYGVASKGNTVFVIGGWDLIIPGLQTVEAYRVPSNTWTAGLPPMPTGRAEAGACGHGGRVYIVGGAQPGFGASVNANEVFKP